MTFDDKLARLEIVLGDTKDFVLTKYLVHVEAYCCWKQVNGQDPDEKFMRNIEEYAGINENAKKVWREEILISISALTRRNKRFTLITKPRLNEAIEKFVLMSLVFHRERVKKAKELLELLDHAKSVLENGEFENAKIAIEDIVKSAEKL